MGERRRNLPALRGERATAFNQECFRCHIEKASKRRFEAITAKKGGNAPVIKGVPYCRSQGRRKPRAANLVQCG